MVLGPSAAFKTVTMSRGEGDGDGVRFVAGVQGANIYMITVRVKVRVLGLVLV